jgi:type II secretory pathway component PulF
MNFYRYEARDKAGALIKGAVQALSAEDVQTDLSKKGLRLVKIDPIGAPSQSLPPPPNLYDPPTPRVAAPPVHQSSSPFVNRPIPPNGLNPSVFATEIHTKKGTDKQRFFIFSQLGSAFRAGINASDAFSQVAQRSAEQFTDSLRHASLAAAEGTAVSEIFSRYPDLYPPDVVGLTRAGEAAGFLPDAFDEIARQAESVHAFRRWFFWIWFLAINTLLSVPLMKVTDDAVLRMWNDQSANGGAGGSGTLFHEMWLTFLWPWGPITFVSYLAAFALNRWLASNRSREFRHRLGLKVPVYGKRALNENLARFSWTMARVSRIGMSPARSWSLAAESVPNLAFRHELEHVGAALSGQEKMSDIFFRSKLFPDEYAPMIATAEYTGDYSGALDKLATVSAGEFVAAQNYAKARSGCWGVLFAFVVGAFLMGSLLYTWVNQIPTQVMKDSDEGN